jgi:hypothetical protein
MTVTDDGQNACYGLYAAKIVLCNDENEFAGLTRTLSVFIRKLQPGFCILGLRDHARGPKIISQIETLHRATAEGAEVAH